MAYTGKKPGNVNTDFLEAGGKLANHDEVTVDASGNVTATSFSGDGANLTGINTDLVSDTTPQLGGNLDGQSYNITTSGRVGIGTSSPTTPLEVHGSGSSGRILLSANDTPMITNGFDKFTSGSYQGAGRWGLFMEPNTLTIGVKETSGSIAFKHFAADSTSTERMRIDSSGRVTKPYQPAFNVDGNHPSGGGVWLANGVKHNVGGHYSTSTGRFTAPVSGIYLFYGQLFVNTTATCQWNVQVNGSDIVELKATGESAYDSYTFQKAVSLSANDYIDVTWAGPFSGLSGGHFTYWGGYLLG